MVNMRISPFAIISIVLVLIALVLVLITSGLSPLTMGVATATALVVLTMLYLGVRHPVRSGPVPVENFSLWADVGEPAAELRRLSPDDVEAAVRIANADLGALSSNAKLLNSRISLLIGRPEFEGLTREKMDLQMEDLFRSLRESVKKLSAKKRFSPEALSSLERCAAQAGQIANKLYDFQRGKPELVHIYLEPLCRAAEKLSRDLKRAFENMSDFMKGATVQPEGGEPSGEAPR